MISGVSKAPNILPALSGLLASWGAVELWERWLVYRRVHRERTQLLAMTERELNDIGISRVDAIREANRPAWRSDDTN